MELHGHGLLAGRTVLVTAAAGAGIGFATARRAGLEGARVMLSDRHERRLAESAERLAEELRREVCSAPCDVTQEADVRALFESAEAALGGVDVLVNNAGLGLTKLVVETTDEEWSRVLDVTLTSTVRCTRAALRHMRGRGGGVIVNVASETGWRAEPGQAAYGAAKAGVMAFTRCAALEAAADGIRINVVVPTITMHPFLEKVSDKDTLESMIALQVQGRAADPDEIARVIAFVASDLASYMTGEAVSVSGQHA